GIIPQMKAEPGMPARQAVFRRQARVREIIHTLPHAAQVAIAADLAGFAEASPPIGEPADVA
ncbi:ABC transporter ATP-binding protein, partial [Nocardia fluminea]